MKTSKGSSRVSVATLSDDDLLCHLKSVNLWDCLDLGGPYNRTQSQRLFGHTNIGNLNLCNMQIGGQLSGDQSMVVMNWYARTNIERTPEFEHYIGQTYATFIAGEKPRWISPVSALLSNNRPPLWPEVLVARQAFNMHVDTFSSAMDGLINRIEEQLNRSSQVGRYLWFHLEGLMIPRELYMDDVDSASDPKVYARWRSLQAKVLRLLTSQRSQAVDTAEHIARWASSMADDAASDEVRSQLVAIADGIREERFRPERTGP